MTDYLSNQSALNKRIKLIIENENIDNHRFVINNIADQLAIDTLTAAAALLHLSQNIEDTLTPSSLKNQTIEPQALTHHRTLNIKMVRYRLDVGSQHLITLEQLKRTLVEESGVDKNNINNIKIQSLYTLIELPDEMPADIFQHLKSVEINQRKLDIKRVKTRNNKRRGNNHLRRTRKPDYNPLSNQVTCNKIAD